MKNKIEKYIRILYDYGITDPRGCLYKYLDPHRYFHTWEHIEWVLKALEPKLYNGKLALLNPTLYIAAIFHDVVYDPTKNDNEEQSAKLLLSVYNKDTDKMGVDIYLAVKMIIGTKDHRLSDGLLPALLYEADLSGLHSKDIDFIIRTEKQIFQEYQFVDFKTFVIERIKTLNQLYADPLRIDYVKSWRPNIAIYAGSFNPFHKGHLNILQKAEQIFDKVIIAQGYNLGKDIPSYIILNKTLKYHQKEVYTGLLTDFIAELKYPVTLIRGLRDTSDFQYEIKQLRYLQDLMPQINVISIICDKEYSHISSSDLRALKQHISPINAKYEVL